MKDVLKMLLSKNTMILFYSIICISCIITFLIINNFDLISYRVFDYAPVFNQFPDPPYNWLLGLLCFVFLTFVVSLFNNKNYLKLWLF